MNWIPFTVASISAGVAVCFTDWFFTGVLFHDRYKVYPEIWRKRTSEAPAIVCSTLLGFASSAAFIAACAAVGLHSYRATLGLAGLCWLAGPLPLTITNALYIKLDRLVVSAHALGWLVRLSLAAVAAGWMLA